MVRLINGVLMVSSRKICKAVGTDHDKCYSSITSKTHRYVDFMPLVVRRKYSSQKSHECYEVFVSLEGLKWILDHDREFTARGWLKVSEIIKEVFEVDYPLENNADNVVILTNLIEENIALKAQIKELEVSLTASKANVKTLQATFQKAFEIIGGLPLC